MHKDEEVMNYETIILLAVIFRNPEEDALRIKNAIMGPYFKIQAKRVGKYYVSGLIPDKYWVYFSSVNVADHLQIPNTDPFYNPYKTTDRHAPLYTSDVKQLMYKIGK